MCLGVAPSGLPIPKSMMSSPRARAAAFNSLVMLKTYGGRRFRRRNSCMAFDPTGLLDTLISITFRLQRVGDRGYVRSSSRFQRDVDDGVAKIDTVISTIVQSFYNVRTLIGENFGQVMQGSGPVGQVDA